MPERLLVPVYKAPEGEDQAEFAELDSEKGVRFRRFLTPGLLSRALEQGSQMSSQDGHTQAQAYLCVNMYM